jgi:hypothetical protein
MEINLTNVFTFKVMMIIIHFLYIYLNFDSNDLDCFSFIGLSYFYCEYFGLNYSCYHCHYYWLDLKIVC